MINEKTSPIERRIANVARPISIDKKYHVGIKVANAISMVWKNPKTEPENNRDLTSSTGKPPLWQ